MDSETRVHPDCIKASNPYHECVEYCFKKIAEAKTRLEKEGLVEAVGGRGYPYAKVHEQARESLDDKRIEEESSEEDEEEDNQEPEVDVTQLTGRKKKFFEDLRWKSNQTDVGSEKKKMEAPTETKGISKQKWLEERKKKIGKLLDANGLDMTKAYMLATQEAAETNYKKWEKEPKPSGWDVFNQKTLYNAYKKRTKNIQVDLEEYNRMRAADLEFYREASSLQYGKIERQKTRDHIGYMAC
ncbi:unnamed protein product [Arabis nemorensis]|uniref:Pre-mRNA-splicing factor SYF2 n=1 Tax=Arabis nemorensis TaxID=586526 RepID=A0A565BQY2_9BRAS|nr:unnamed protein product [Arabis nemorensis]